MCEMMLCGLSGHVWKGNVFNKEQMLKDVDVSKEKGVSWDTYGMGVPQMCFIGNRCFLGYIRKTYLIDVFQKEQMYQRKMSHRE